MIATFSVTKTDFKGKMAVNRVVEQIDYPQNNQMPKIALTKK